MIGVLDDFWALQLILKSQSFNLHLDVGCSIKDLCRLKVKIPLFHFFLKSGARVKSNLNLSYSDLRWTSHPFKLICLNSSYAIM